MCKYHQPVMLTETLTHLIPKSGGFYIDGTLGAGGHAAAILDASSFNGHLLGLDRDPIAISIAQEELRSFGDRVVLKLANFDCIGDVMRGIGREKADGILLDLGVSSMQLDQYDRGFSFKDDSPLDMRMDCQGKSVAELLATIDEEKLIFLLREYGEEPLAPRIARVLVHARNYKSIVTTGHLSSLVKKALPTVELHNRKIHPATKVFQALRIAVNDELNCLNRFFDKMLNWLVPGGRIVVVSYHSLEDRVVKRALTWLSNPCSCSFRLAMCICGKYPLVKLLTPKPLCPGKLEIKTNPRARSARLRAAMRTMESVIIKSS